MSEHISRNNSAVVVGGGINGLGVLRSLASAGVPVTVLDTDAKQPAMRSRYGRKQTYRSDRADSVVSALEHMASKSANEPPLLVLTQEEAVATVSAHRERLEHLYRIALPKHEVLTALLHKDGFRAVAESAGAIIPRTLHLTEASQTETINALQPPLVVKPSVRDAGYSSAFRKAYRVDTVDEAQDLVRDILPTLPDVVVQEWIEGSDSDIYFCLQYITCTGDTAASFVGRKIRSWPPRVGGTASCAPASEQETNLLTERTTAFFKHAGVRGFASMEYKRDVRSGEFFMVEPTVGRTDYQEEVATLNGVNIPLAAYRAEFGLTTKPAKTRQSPLIWRDRMSDIQSAALADDVEPWRPGRAWTADALWRFSDPMPGVTPFYERVKRRALRMVRRTDTAPTTNKPES